MLAHHRRRVVHFNVTEHPTAHWTAQQIVDAFPNDSAPSYLLRDRDHAYGPALRHRVKGMEIAEVLTAPSSPWQNPFAERLNGSIRRECLDHVLILNELHLRRIRARYVSYPAAGAAAAQRRRRSGCPARGPVPPGPVARRPRSLLQEIRPSNALWRRTIHEDLCLLVR